MALSPKQLRFVDEYLVDLNATQAAIRAGYSADSAASQGWDLLQKPEIREAIEVAALERAKRVQVSGDDILRRLKEIAFVDLRHAYDENGRLKGVQDLPSDVARALAGIKVYDEFEGSGDERVKVGEVRELKFNDRLRALELLGKNIAIFTDKVEHNLGPTLAELLAKARTPKDGK